MRLTSAPDQIDRPLELTLTPEISPVKTQQDIFVGADVLGLDNPLIAGALNRYERYVTGDLAEDERGAVFADSCSVINKAGETVAGYIASGRSTEGWHQIGDNLYCAVEPDNESPKLVRLDADSTGMTVFNSWENPNHVADRMAGVSDCIVLINDYRKEVVRRTLTNLALQG